MTAGSSSAPARLADGAGGCAEAPRGHLRRRRGLPHRAASPRAPGRGGRPSARSSWTGRGGPGSVLDAVKALREIGAAAELLPQADGAAERPILGILPFHLLVLDLAERRGVNPYRIRWDQDPWKRARDSYE